MIVIFSSKCVQCPQPLKTTMLQISWKELILIIPYISQKLYNIWGDPINGEILDDEGTGGEFTATK